MMVMRFDFYLQVFFISIAWMMNSDLSKLRIFLSK